MVLSKIDTPEDLKNLKLEDLKVLSKEIRRFLIKSVARTGGHLSSNLGVVELSIALHYVFNSPDDKIVWDVGHQAYIHKILTGRKNKFKTLRQEGGISGFPKRDESEHDVFDVGHSSTSISAALGMAIGRDLSHEKNYVISVIGDGALSGGMAFEGLNNAGRGNANLIVILNDNEMSISRNVGGLSKYLTRMRSTKQYTKVKEGIESMLSAIPIFGNPMSQALKRTKGGIKTLLVNNTWFEELGFSYLGPIDGHNIPELIEILNNAKQMKGPILVHVKTVKGKGYSLAQNDPSKYHGISIFDYKTGNPINTFNGINFSDAFGEAIIKLAKENSNIVAITAAMTAGTGLTKFEDLFPKRFFDVGIAEQHAVTFAGGLAVQGYRPIVAIYSSFLQRAYDQILHDVALQNLDVIFMVDRAGLVGEDGETHQGIFDISYLSNIPNIKILSPKLPQEIEGAMRYALKQKGPVVIRYPRGGTNISVDTIIDYNNPIPVMHYKGKKAAILSFGKSVEWAFEIRDYIIAQYKIEVAIIEIPYIMPVDDEELFKLIKTYGTIITIEDHVLVGGFGSIISTILHKVQSPKKLYSFGFENGIVQHGKINKLLEHHELSPKQIGDTIYNDILKK
ncbi:1-deoxy-D-xylulose-5-phosphate synthase [Candidatus Epulonipiscium fishelsonii]|uniref:1-deoxy-D-xylulose-5-phosphate synthase n=1 Tax=Candidatus Epulonipiscium fishelsonii TaxID=77094 RepID=A0ACC8X7P8_9FIRM|nr:1-deoxy-D-xylulose-5-phosphate synthase [Epulopiscium sp. SCG-B11WGA-EpuloA1]